MSHLQMPNTKTLQTPEEHKQLISRTIYSQTIHHEEPTLKTSDPLNVTSKRQYITKVCEITENVTVHSENQPHNYETGLNTRTATQTKVAHITAEATAIAGIYVESSKKKMSFLEASEKGFLAKTYAVEFLEAQAATGCITDLATGQTFSALEALERGIIESGLKNKLLEAEKAVTGYIHAGKRLSVFQAMQQRLLDRYQGKIFLEVQLSSGGLINPETGVRVPASAAIDQGLVDKETLQSLYEPVSNHKGFHNPDTGQKAYYSEILKTCLYDIDGGVFLFPFGDRHVTNISPHKFSQSMCRKQQPGQ